MQEFNFNYMKPYKDLQLRMDSRFSKIRRQGRPLRIQLSGVQKAGSSLKYLRGSQREDVLPRRATRQAEQKMALPGL